jgi:hypothetical protein
MFEHSSRFGPRLKLFLSELRDDENPHVGIIIRTKMSLESEMLSQLDSLGAEIRTVAGNIVTLLLPARNLPKLAQEEYVVYIELTRPLYPE